MLFLTQILGIYFLITAALMLLRKKVFVSVIEAFYSDPAAIFLPGLIASFLGLLMVLTHTVWTTIPDIVVTLIGWGALLKGLWLMFFPHSAVSSIDTLKVREWTYVYGGILLVLGVYLTYVGFSL